MAKHSETKIMKTSFKSTEKAIFFRISRGNFEGRIVPQRLHVLDIVNAVPFRGCLLYNTYTHAFFKLNTFLQVYYSYTQM